MKSREEYQASIYAKRDALLEKRKKKITKAVTGTATAVLLTSCVIALPLINKNLRLESELTVPAQTQTVTAVTTKEDSYGAFFSTNDDIGTINKGNITETEAEAEGIEEATKKSTEPALDSAEGRPSETDVTDYTEASAETEPYDTDGSDSAVVPEMYAEQSFSYEQIAEAAFAFLSTQQQSECIDKDNPEVISAVSAEESFYLVTFLTESEKTYQVKLIQSSLELVEINTSFVKEHRAPEEPLTHQPGYKGGQK